MIANPILSLNGEGWTFKSFYGEDWLWRGSHLPDTRDRRQWFPARVPGSVIDDLWRCGEIANPYVRRNSLAAEWAADRTWIYRRNFTVPAEAQGRRAVLICEGVDYEARFYLNGELLGRHTGLYTPARFEVSGLLKPGEANLLAVVIAPAPFEQPQVGYTSQVRTHKSRMTYWWDFCPRLVHQGLWDGVRIEFSGPARIADLWVRSDLSDDFQHARLLVTTALEAPAGFRGEARATLQLVGDQNDPPLRRTAPFEPGQATVVQTFELEQPHLWWPNGLGEQPLYEVEVQVYDSAGLLSGSRRVTTGIRRLEFRQNENSSPDSLPYTLVANGQRAYLKGWNWVPIDVNYGVERPEKLAHLLTLAKEAHVNMLRVWGGGLIEKESFYNLCDRLGLLVWQEFIQSSSGIDNLPPDDPAFIAWIADQARQIVPRKRNHPSLALWCGGNELQTGLEQPADNTNPMLAALKAVVTELDPGRYWLPTSPSGPVFSNSLEAIVRDPASLHDVHGPWEFQGLEKHYTLSNQGASLLHSEFGVEGITNQATLDATLTPEQQSPVDLDNPFWFHLGAWWVKVPAWQAAFGEIKDGHTWQRATQYLQYAGLRYAVEADRRRQYHNSGTLPWQFNEPYPMAACTSAVDYYGRPKPAYYAVAGAYAPLLVSARFDRAAWGGYEDFEAEVWVSNSYRHTIENGQLEMALFTLTGQPYASQSVAVSIPADASHRLAPFCAALPGLAGDLFFLDLRLKAGEAVLAENRYLFSRTEDLAPLLSLPLVLLELKMENTEPGRSQIRLYNSSEIAAVYTWLEDGRAPLSEGEQSEGWVVFSANYFTLLPGEAREVEARWQGVPAGARNVRVTSFNGEDTILA